MEEHILPVEEYRYPQLRHLYLVGHAPLLCDVIVGVDNEVITIISADELEGALSRSEPNLTIYGVGDGPVHDPGPAAFDVEGSNSRGPHS